MRDEPCDINAVDPGLVIHSFDGAKDLAERVGFDNIKLPFLGKGEACFGTFDADRSLGR